MGGRSGGGGWFVSKLGGGWGEVGERGALWTLRVEAEGGCKTEPKCPYVKGVGVEVRGGVLRTERITTRSKKVPGPSPTFILGQ